MYSVRVRLKKKKRKEKKKAIVSCLTTFGWGCFIISIKTQFLVHLWNMKNTHPLLMKQNMVFGRALSNIVKVVIMAFLIFSIKFKPLEAARPLNVIMKSKHGATKLGINPIWSSTSSTFTWSMYLHTCTMFAIFEENGALPVVIYIGELPTY